MSLGTILLIVIVLLLIGAIPSWPHSRVRAPRHHHAARPAERSS